MAIDLSTLTKQYANPWDTSYSYLDSTGANLGTGYDSYQDAIRKLAFNVGKSYFGGAAAVEPTPVLNGSGESGWGMTAGSAAMPAGWMYSISPQGSPMVYDGSGESGMSGGYTTGGVGSPAFATEQALYDYMLKAPTGPISYDSTEKYGRALKDGQMQNMFALLSDPARAKQVLEAYGGVPDWEHHREGYNAAYNPIAGINVSGANALVGSTPVFGDDGRITGYKITNPKHINGADTSGRVQSSTNGATKYNSDLASYATPMGDGSLFISADNADKFGYTSMGASSYSKAPTMAARIGKAGTLAFLGSALGGAAGFGPLAGGGSIGGAAGTGGSMFEGLGDWFSSLFDSAPQALGEAGGYDWLSSEVLSGGMPQLLGEAGGYGLASDPGFFQSLIDQAKSDPLGSASKALKLINGGDTGSADLMKLLGSLGAAGLGAYASNQQSGDMNALAKRYEGYGAPYRQKLSALYANPDSFLQSNEVQKPVQMGTDNLMRSLSMQGNPFGSGNALQQGQSYASDQLFGRLGQEKDRLAGFGGLSSYNQAAPQAATNAIGSNANMYNAIGSGIGNIFNPPKSESQTMAEFMRAMRG